jgi:hypothetical protein
MPLHSQDGNTALLRSVFHGYVECARLMLEAGANKNAKDSVRDHFMRLHGCLSRSFGGSGHIFCFQLHVSPLHATL